MACFWPANRDVCFLFLCVVRILHSIRQNKRLLRADPCCRSVIKEFAHAFSCVSIELWMHAGSLESTQVLELLSDAPRATLTHSPCSPNFLRASIARYTHAKHEQILIFQEARVALGYASSNSYASFVHSKLPACFISRWTHADVWTNC